MSDFSDVLFGCALVAVAVFMLWRIRVTTNKARKEAEYIPVSTRMPLGEEWDGPELQDTSYNLVDSYLSDIPDGYKIKYTVTDYSPSSPLYYLKYIRIVCYFNMENGVENENYKVAFENLIFP